jgi:hypothetical protein
VERSKKIPAIIKNWILDFFYEFLGDKNRLWGEKKTLGDSSIQKHKANKNKNTKQNKKTISLFIPIPFSLFNTNSRLVKKTQYYTFRKKDGSRTFCCFI